jgi:hypothetical protein
MHPLLPFFFFFFFLFWGLISGAYTCATPSALFALVIFQLGSHIFAQGWTGPESSYLCFPHSSGDRCEPPLPGPSLPLSYVGGSQPGLSLCCPILLSFLAALASYCPRDLKSWEVGLPGAWHRISPVYVPAYAHVCPFMLQV